MKIFVTYDTKGKITSVDSPAEEVEDEIFLEVTKPSKVIELKPEEITQLRAAAQGGKIEECAEQELQRRLKYILESHLVDTKRNAIVRK